jgi:hypothetical protein
MVKPQIISKVFNLRVLLFIVTLFSLCVSNNVGVSFLPLGIGTEQLAEMSERPQRESGPRLPSPSETDSFRVPIMGHQKKRVTKQPIPQPVAALLKAVISLPDRTQVATEGVTPISISRLASISQPPGRAPPRSV